MLSNNLASLDAARSVPAMSLELPPLLRIALAGGVGAEIGGLGGGEAGLVLAEVELGPIFDGGLVATDVVLAVEAWVLGAGAVKAVVTCRLLTTLDRGMGVGVGVGCGVGGRVGVGADVDEAPGIKAAAFGRSSWPTVMPVTGSLIGSAPPWIHDWS